MPDSLGLIGEDLAIEAGVSVVPLEPIVNRSGYPLRFALLGRAGASLAGLVAAERPSVVTSYPVMAAKLAAEIGLKAEITYVKGCIEAEVADGTFDGAIELVQSGDSVRDNGLEILADDLYAVRLMKIGEGEIE